MKNKKIIAVFIVAILALTMTATLVACSSKDKDIPSHELTEVDAVDFVDFLVDSAANSFTAEDGKYFSADSRLVYEWKNGDQIEKYYLNVAFTLDLDPSRASRDNQLMVELKKYVDGGSAKMLLGVHYIEQLEGYDYSPLFLTVGEHKFQYKASSIKDVLNGGGDVDLGINKPNQDTLFEVKEILSLILGITCRDFKINADQNRASMAFNVAGVLDIVKSFISQGNEDGELDDLFAQAGIDLTVEQLLAIEAKFDIEVNFEFDEGYLENVTIVMNIHDDQYVHIQTVDGKDIVNIKLAKGTVSISVDSLRIFGDKGHVYLPDDIENYKLIGLVNVDIGAKVNFYRADGSVNNGANSVVPIEVWLRADINPFVLLSGITADNLSELGMLHIRAANEKGVLFEIVFDPKNTGTNSLYATFASMQTGLIKQDLTFELEATIEILQELIGNTAEYNATGGSRGGILEQILGGITIGAVEREDGGKNVLVTMDIAPLREAVDSLLPGGVDILGTKLYLSNILLGDGNVTATMEFTGFRYGQLDASSYDATGWMNKGSSSLVKQVLGVNGKEHKGEYTQGEALQYSAGSALQLKVELLNGKTSGALQPLNAKVLKIEGYDPNILGEQQVTLYLRDNGLFASIIAGAVATDFELPLGVITYSYIVNVTAAQ